MMTTNKPLIQIQHLTKQFFHRKKPLLALQDINLSIPQGQTLGLAGESGCGKSTLGKTILRLENPTSGSILFQEIDIASMPSKALRSMRRHMQMVFQDPYASLNPRMTIEEIIGEGLDIHNLATGQMRRQIIVSLLIKTGLDSSILDRYPHEFSGGQCQRISIARALAVDPLFIVFDEPLSALDTCTQQQVIQLFLTLKREKKLTSLFISHDLNAMRTVADTIAIMYLGRIVEQAPSSRLFISPTHPYTQALLSAIPDIDPIKAKLRLFSPPKGEPPSPLSPPAGCPFHPRCPHATALCQTSMPVMREHTPNHYVACHHVTVDIAPQSHRDTEKSG